MKLGWQERWIGKADEWIYGWTDRHTHIKREREIQQYAENALEKSTRIENKLEEIQKYKDICKRIIKQGRYCIWERSESTEKHVQERSQSTRNALEELAVKRMY